MFIKPDNVPIQIFPSLSSAAAVILFSDIDLGIDGTLIQALINRDMFKFRGGILRINYERE
jgi:hypothetical protein